MKKKTTTHPTITDFADTHDGKQAKAVFIAAIETVEFADPAQPLQIFTNLRTALLAIHDQPAKVIPAFQQQTADLTDAQQLFIARKVKAYFANTVFGGDETDEESDGEYLTGITEPLSAYITRLERETLPRVDDIRANLKELFRKEMAGLPEMLGTLETKDRLNFLIKLMPFVLPKVEAVAATEGEPSKWHFFD
jgi:hypothetical protein